MIRGVARLPPGSGLRRFALSQGTRRAFAAVNRSDYEVVRLGYDPGVEIWTSGMEATGINDCYTGHEGIREMFMELDAVFVAWGWTIHDVIDRGDRFALRMDLVTRGRSSDVETTVEDAGAAYRLTRQGKVVQQHFFVERGGWHRALDVVNGAD
jgi:ketosteroid isomerase-like protein